MIKTSSQIAVEVLNKTAKFPFRPAAPKYVTQAEMSAAKDRALSQLKPASKTAPSSMPTERKSLSEIPVWPHKTASQIADSVLNKLSFQGRMGFEANAAGAATGPVAPAVPAPAAPKPPTPAAAPMPKVGSIADAVLKKLAEGEQLDEQYYEDTPSRKRHWPLGVAGLLAGGAAAHYLAPSQMTKSYRETAKGLEEPAKASLEAHKPSYDPKLDKFTGTLPEEHMTHIKDVSAAGRPVRFNAPAHAAQKYFKSRAWAESMPRTLGGAGLGLGAGLLASSLF